MVSLTRMSNHIEHGAVRDNLQMCPDSFLRCHMVHICFGNSETTLIGRSAADTSAIPVDRGEVVCKASIAEVKCTGKDDCVSESLVGDQYERPLR